MRDHDRVDTLILGGGIAGLACARTLADARRPFLLVTDRLGGRLYAGADGLNLGAAYVTSDYRRVLRFVDRGARVFMKDVYFWDGGRFQNVFHRANLSRLPGLARLYALLVPFRRRLLRLRRDAARVCQRDLLDGDPVLRRYAEQPAAELVRAHGLEALNEIYCGPILHSTLFVPWDQVNAFYWLANLFPILLPTWAVDARRALPRLTRGFEDRVVTARATAVEEQGDGFRVSAGDRELRARNLVVALPGRNSEPLLPTEHRARDVPFSTLHVRGRRRAAYVPGKTVFLRAEHPARVLWPQRGGVDIVYAAEPRPELSRYYEEHEIVASVAWKTAIQISGAEWRPLQLRRNLFAIGDHNLCGLEDSYLTGVYAANRILDG